MLTMESAANYYALLTNCHRYIKDIGPGLGSGLVVTSVTRFEHPEEALSRHCQHSSPPPRALRLQTSQKSVRLRLNVRQTV